MIVIKLEKLATTWTPVKTTGGVKTRMEYNNNNNNNNNKDSKNNYNQHFLRVWRFLKIPLNSQNLSMCNWLKPNMQY